MDLHFLLRTGISGGVFIAAFCLGATICGAPILSTFLKQTSINSGLGTMISAAIVALSPVIGVFLQGIYLLYVSAAGGMFKDPTRAYAAKQVREAALRHGAWPFPDPLESLHDDAFFVAIYHTHAPSHLIEWARRRRSYHYLGVTYALGSSIGFILGLLACNVWPDNDGPVHTTYRILVGASLVGSVIAALILAGRMLRDVNDMEAIWTLMHINDQVGTDLRIQIHKPWT